MAIKNRKYRRRLGERTYSGNKKNKRGHGNKGGRGFSGKYDVKELKYLKMFGKEYFGRKGFNSIKPRYKYITLDDVERMAVEKDGKLVCEAKKYRVIGNGKITKAVEVLAAGVTESAKQKIEGAGGSVKVL